MYQEAEYIISFEEKEQFIRTLTPQLAALRRKAGISQDELAQLIGVSRQTYGAVERGVREMSWSTYLALILFYDYNRLTHNMLHVIGAFPQELLRHFQFGAESSEVDLGSFLDTNARSIVDCLDEQALHTIRTMILLEYARCTSTPGEAVVRAYNGLRFTGLPKLSASTEEAPVGDGQRTRRKTGKRTE